MASGKRASMREGPLASLFSRTGGETAEEEASGEETTLPPTFSPSGARMYRRSPSA